MVLMDRYSSESSAKSRSVVFLDIEFPMSTPIIENYKMMGLILSTVHQYPYLGVELSEDLGWEPHINKTISKANKVLGFLRRNIGKCPQDIKKKAYLTLVRPHLEYSSAVWDPHRKQHISSMDVAFGWMECHLPCFCPLSQCCEVFL
jgi:hypothetical protein